MRLLAVKLTQKIPYFWSKKFPEIVGPTKSSKNTKEAPKVRSKNSAHETPFHGAQYTLFWDVLFVCISEFLCILLENLYYLENFHQKFGIIWNFVAKLCVTILQAFFPSTQKIIGKTKFRINYKIFHPHLVSVHYPEY